MNVQKHFSETTWSLIANKEKFTVFMFKLFDTLAKTLFSKKLMKLKQFYRVVMKQTHFISQKSKC